MVVTKYMIVHENGKYGHKAVDWDAITFDEAKAFFWRVMQYGASVRQETRDFFGL